MTVSRFLSKYSYYLLSVFRLLFGFENPILLIRIFLNLEPAGVKTIRLRGRGLQFNVRGAMDIWSIKETFLDRFYERYGFSLKPGWKVIDIGAGIGDYTLYAAAAQDGIQVYAFEPFPQSYALMQENLQRNRIANVRAFDKAVAAVSGALVLDLAGGEPLQIQSRLGEAGKSQSNLPVDAVSLADVFDLLQLDSCDMLKLDCEGAEYSILFETPQPILERIQHIVMEYHDQVVEHNHQDLVRFLSERGFRVETFPNPVHSDLGYLRAIRTQ